MHTDAYTCVHRPVSPCPTPAALGGCHPAQLASGPHGADQGGMQGMDQGTEMLNRTETTALESKTALI